MRLLFCQNIWSKELFFWKPKLLDAKSYVKGEVKAPRANARKTISYGAESGQSRFFS